MSSPPYHTTVPRDTPADITDRPAGQRRQNAKRKAKIWLAPGMGIKRWLTLFTLCTFVGAVGFLHFTWTGPLHFVATKWILWINQFAQPPYPPLYVAGMVVMALALMGAFASIFMLSLSMLKGTGTAPGTAVDMIYERRTLARGPRYLTVGGGTGLSNLLTGLKKYSSNISAVVTVADDGGSSGRLREALGMVAPGDLTDCYAALSDSPVLARLLLHRFDRGEGIEGHTFGNLLLATLSEEQKGNLGLAMQDIHEVLRVRGEVLPATTQPSTLVAHLRDGRVIRGESQLARQVGSSRIERIKLDPPDLVALPQVLEAIQNAELIVLGPGSLFTSIIPALIVPQIAAAIRAAAANVLYVASIMTEPGETDHFTLQDHVDAITRHVGRAPDIVLMNDRAVEPAVLKRYAAEGSQPVDLTGASRDLRSRVIFRPLLQEGTAHHDPDALAKALLAFSASQKG